jgi:hypothetical protein
MDPINPENPPSTVPTPSAPDTASVPVYDRHETGVPWARVALISVGVLIVGAIGGFFIGKATTDSGPSTLADAISQTASGSLARGDVTTAVRNAGGARVLFAGGGTGGGAAGSGTSPGGPGGGGGGTGGGFGRGLRGTVSSIDGNVLTLQTQAGTLKENLTNSTTYLQTASGQRSELTVGQTVGVRPDFTAGGSSSGSSVTASVVTIQPAGTAPTSAAGGGSPGQ